mmetsp:Transcript_30768/g.95185  ORF Transcript_30768/g.95185 Transcript_30768/m.95185 type:complete len:152 (+) Transcript_30768:228-683(+)
MWLLSCRSAPEELIGSATLSAMKLKDAMEGDEIDCHVKAKMASDLLDGELRELKLILIGDAEREHDEDRGARVAAAAIEQHEFVTSLISCLSFLPLETQKNVSHVFANLARRPEGCAFAAVVAQDAAILSSLTAAYKDERADFALLCGIML